MICISEVWQNKNRFWNSSVDTVLNLRSLMHAYWVCQGSRVRCEWSRWWTYSDPSPDLPAACQQVQDGGILLCAPCGLEWSGIGYINKEKLLTFVFNGFCSKTVKKNSFIDNCKIQIHSRVDWLLHVAEHLWSGLTEFLRDWPRRWDLSQAS